MATVLIPILFLLLTICLDLSELYSEKAEMQRLIDEAALYGYRFLPFQTRAELAVEGYLNDLSKVRGSFNSVVRSDEVAISYHGRAPFRFAALWGISQGLEYEVNSRVKSAPINGVVLIEASQDVAPDERSELWGEETEWPAARLFEHYLPFASSIDARRATQQCFNPIFSGIKLAALRLFDYLTSFEKNDVTLGFIPGTLNEVDIVNRGQSPLELSANMTPEYFNIANGTFSKNGYCLAALKEEGAYSPYLLPPQKMDAPSPRELPNTELAGYRVSERDLDALTTRELIWTRAVRPGVSSIRSILDQVLKRFAEAHRPGTDDWTRRDGFSRDMAVIFASDVPREGNQRFPDDQVQAALRLSLARLVTLYAEEGQAAASLYYVLFDPHDRRRGERNAEMLQGFFNDVHRDLRAPVGIEFRVIYSQEIEGLAQGVIRSIALRRHTAVIDG